MSELSIKKKGFQGVSPQMALLHLRWQQIRWELLQQASSQPNLLEGTQSSHVGAHKKGYATA